MTFNALKGSLSSFVGSAKENISNSQFGSFFKNLSTNEPHQYIEAEQLGLFYITKRVIGMGYPSFDTLLTGSALDPQKQQNKQQKPKIKQKTIQKKQKIIKKSDHINENDNNNNQKLSDLPPKNDNNNNNNNDNNIKTPKKIITNEIIDDTPTKSTGIVGKITNFIQNESLAHRISRYLNKYHKERYMIWNLSEKSYDTSIFNDNVIEFKFPGYPAPPLEKLFQLLTSIDSWLNSHNDNIAIIHCQTGKGRTVTCISAYLAWSKYENYNPAKSLLHVCKVMNGTIKNLTIPSQTRYLAYLTKILVNRQMPKSNPMTISKIIVKGIPIFESFQQTYIEKINDNNNKNDKNNDKKHKNNNINDVQKKELKPKISVGSEEDDGVELGQNVVNLKNNDNNNNSKNDTKQNNNGIIGSTIKEIFKQKPSKPKTIEKTFIKNGVRPYLQIFKNAKLIYSSRKKSEKVKFYDESDSIIKWDVNKEIEGDILIRIRHLDITTKQKISVCRYAFHTGYLEKQGVIRFKKTQLDGAWNSERFPKDFWIDMNIGNANEKITPQTKQQQKFWEDISRRSVKMSRKFEHFNKKFVVGGSSDMEDDGDDSGDDGDNDKHEKAKEFDQLMESNSNNNNDNNNKNTEKKEKDLIEIESEKVLKTNKNNPYLDTNLLKGIDTDMEKIKKIENQSKIKDKNNNNNDKNLNKKNDENNENNENNEDDDDNVSDMDINDMDIDAIANKLDLDNVSVDSETEQDLEKMAKELDNVQEAPPSDLP